MLKLSSFGPGQCLYRKLDSLIFMVEDAEDMPAINNMLYVRGLGLKMGFYSGWPQGPLK